MTLTIKLKKDLEKQLRSEAAKTGMDASRYVESVVEERLQKSQQQPPHLSRAEAELLQKINLGLSEQQWRRYRELLAERRAETLAAEEQKELVALSDQIEQANGRRMENLIELAKLRQVSLEAQMSELGIKPRVYV